MCGWIKLHRGIFDHWIASDSDYLCVWLRMLTEANFEDKKHLFNGALLEIKRGQVIFGLEAWSTKTGVTIAKLRKLIDMLEKDKMISRQKTNKYSLISITNYAFYQDDDRQNASKSQAEDNQNATPKELKNIRSKEVNTLVDSGESPSEKDDFLSGLFEKFWKNYNCEKTAKVKKQDAKKAFSRLMRGKSNEKAEMTTYAMLTHYQDNLVGVVFGADRMHPTTYINKRQWEDDPEFMENFEREWMKENAAN